jgi:hypothetical protein
LAKGIHTEDIAMRWFTFVTVTTVLVVGGLLQIDMAAQERAKEKGGAKQEAAKEADRADTLKTLHDAARATYEGTVSSFQSGLLQPSEVYTWSLRWRGAAVKVAKNEAGALEASKDHLERMRQLHSKVQALSDSGSRGGEHHLYQATRYYVAEAELFALEAGGDKVAARDK